MAFKLEFEAHEIDKIQYALILLGGHYNELADEDSKKGDVAGFQLHRTKADEVFRIVVNLPSLADHADEIARHNVDVALKAWPGFLSY